MVGTGRFGAVGCAMVTPFDEQGALDTDGAVRLARWLCDQGNDFLVVSGTTGESPVLSDAEKSDLWRAVIGAVSVPVVAGTSTADTAHSVELTKAAVAAGAAGILAVTPYYSRPSQAGIETHMRAIAGAAGGRPVLLYDIPVRSGRKVAPEVILRLAADGVIAGVKDATANPDTLPLLAVGAVGVISVESHWAGEEVAELLAAFAKGDVDHARSVNTRLVPSHRWQSTDAAPNPVPAKAMLRALGLPAGHCRAPMGPDPEGIEDEARAVFSRLRG
jgi:4-hydroxy-tetrahydrodipicolinate synthase